VPNIFLNFHQFRKGAWLGLLLISGCMLRQDINTVTPIAQPATTTQPSTAIVVTNTPDYGWKDVNNLMAGVCFESALDAAGRVFKITSASALDAFYAQVDHSQLCEDPVERLTFPFNEDDVMMGLWSSGTGCTARYEVQNVQRDNAQKQEAIQLRFVAEGDCPYELVEPFWIALPQSADFTIQINVQK